MTIFELEFALTAVILGLALAHIASVAQKLAMAGGRVRWAPEPLLVATIVFLVIIQVWIDQWTDRQVGSLTVGQAILKVLKMMTIYFAAASILPAVEGGRKRVDLLDHYNDTRPLTFGALIAGLLLFLAENIYGMAQSRDWDAAYLVGSVVPIGLYLSLIFVRWRPWNIGVLGLGSLAFLIDILGRTITA